MWGGFEDWMNWLSTQLKISVPDITLDGTMEVFQRRHVIVHSGGFVSPHYLSKAAGSLGIAFPYPRVPCLRA